MTNENTSREPTLNLTDLCEILHTEPGVGFAIVDSEGTIVFLNPRAAALFTQGPAEPLVGKRLEELFESGWVAERREIFRQVAETGKPAVVRHIRFGVQLQSTIHLLTDPGDKHHRILITTVEGEHDPVVPERFDIVESEFAHLGPLEPLTKREIEVLALIGHGLSTNEVAQVLHRSPRTVERHCDSLRAKLRTTNRVQLAAFARRAGLTVEDAKLKRI